MSARLLLEVALRILGVWFIFTAVNAFTATVSFYLSGGWGGPSVDLARLFFASGVGVVVQAALGLILCAPVVAPRFYCEQADGGESPIRVGPGDIYHTACFVQDS
jgi:hypothetical protein